MKKILIVLVMLHVCIAFGTVTYDDNLEHTIDFKIDLSTEGRVYVENNTIVNVVYGADLFLSLSDHSTVNINGGKVWSLTSGNTSTAYIIGGDFLSPGDFYFGGNSVLHISGGLFTSYGGGVVADTNLLENASMIFYGSNFSYTTEGISYFISGILENGDVLDDFWVRKGVDTTIEFVPEPCTLGMLALGGALIRRKRRRRI